VRLRCAESLQLGEDFTLEAWVKPDGETTNDPILFKETGGSASYSLGLGLQAGDKAEAYIGEPDEEYERVVSPQAMEPNVWVQVSATYDGAHLRLYIDGELVATKYTTVPNMPSSGPLDIGCAPDFNEWFNGRIDNVSVFDRALNPGELLEPLQSHLPLCEASSPGGAGSAFARKRKLPDGGTATVYELADGTRIELPNAPVGFDPATASAEELEEYGIPPKPSGAEGAAEWEEIWGAMERGEGEAGVEPICETEDSSEPPIEGATAEGQDQENRIWSGFLASEFGNPEAFSEVQGNYVLSSPLGACQPDAEEVSWVGLGGWSQENQGSQGLLQAGTRVNAEVKCMPGSVYVTWLKKPKEAILKVGARRPDGKAKSRAIKLAHLNPRLFYHGATAEWVDERPTVEKHPRPLLHFENINWTSTYATEEKGNVLKLGEVHHEQLTMTDAEGNVLAKPSGGLFTNTEGFTDEWHRCG
jgi:hypothetical protein